MLKQKFIIYKMSDIEKNCKNYSNFVKIGYGAYGMFTVQLIKMTLMLQ